MEWWRSGGGARLSDARSVFGLTLTRGAARPLGTLGQHGPLKWPLTFSSISIDLENIFPSNFHTLQKNVCFYLVNEFFCAEMSQGGGFPATRERLFCGAPHAFVPLF